MLAKRSISAPSSRLFQPSVNKRANSLHELRNLILKYIINNNDTDQLYAYMGIIYLLHDIISPGQEHDFVEMMDALFRDSADNNYESSIRLIQFIKSWILHGTITLDSLIDLKVIIRKRPSHALYVELISQIEAAIKYSPPIVGRWSPDVTPQSNMLAWMNKSWSAIDIATALTNMCLPFFQLRASDFTEGKFGPTLDLLNKRCSALSHFVTSTILAAARVSEKNAIACTKKWLVVAEELNVLNNFHMMFAIQNGLQTNSVDRINWIFDRLPSKAKKMKAWLDELFNVEDKMKELRSETEKRAGKLCMIPCIYWLHHKAILSKEAPLFMANGTINMQRVISANNIFSAMSTMQNMAYPDLQYSDKVLWYFISLENEVLKADDEMLREVSDKVRTKAGRDTHASLHEPVSWEMLFADTSNELDKNKKNSL